MILKKLTPQQALPKIKHFCAYQERCHKEVATKLYSYGLFKKDVELIIATLIEENFLNEERFAIAYATGKCKINHWGKQKISYVLQQKGVSTFNIKLALKNIDESFYMELIQKLALQKLNSLQHCPKIDQKAKTMQYLLQKGFELPLVSVAIKQLQHQ